MKYMGILAGTVLATAHLSAAAGESTAWWQGGYLGGMGTYLEPSDVREAESKTAGASLFMGLPLQAYSGWSSQLGVAWNELQREDGSGHDKLYQLGLDVLRHFEVTPSLSPYVVTGLALAYEDISDDEHSLPSLSLGGGLDWQTGMSPLRLRLEARAVATENDYEFSGQPTSGRAVLVDGRFGLGLLWAFGKAAPAMADADRDGVSDEADLCPDTLPGAQVDRTGCESLANKDSDGDGVSDAADRCPGTPPGESVDELGCGDQDAVVLKGVNFELDSDLLTAEAQAVLEPIAELLTGGLSSIRIEIAGHTDNQGDADYNQALSARRAYAVKHFLANRGVSVDRMVATGYGDSQPAADNSTAEGRAENRRVVFRVID